MQPGSRLTATVLATALFAMVAPAAHALPSPSRPTEGVSLSPVAQAAADADRGAAAYRAGDFAGAADAFDAAYLLDPLPTYLFNRAQAERLAARCAAALASYRLYLVRVPDASNRAEIDAWIVEQRRCVEASAPTDPVTPPTEVPPAEVQPPLAARTGRGQRITGVGLMVAGVVGVGVGVVGVLGMRGASADIDALYVDGDWSPSDAIAYEDANRRGDRGELVTWIGFGAGVAAGITGAVLYALAPHGERRVTARVAPADGGAVVSLRGAF